ncbi:hypothetical protein Pla175_41340 [Pirellulimonas nuda]|uniref:Uncharacterized protein n=1 Tax=Pirellulimonas nuda TaxID=2528009 RepID=A0A518DGW8_9BACT|nr:hypothetical protein [Pirellulimonas nuda]QDU90723.1 hypothetical protein Pla175_41340 [Pirellulimonas nuda]
MHRWFVCLVLALAYAPGLCGQEVEEIVEGVEGVEVIDDVGTTNYIEVERGKPRPIVDGVGWVMGIPSKLLLWDRRAENHDVSEATQEKVVDYLAEKELTGVKVRVNQYDPLGEWRRLRENEKVGAGWRYTVGGVYTLGYTLVPGRLFGSDWYNPYTDTIHLYSDIPALGMEQAAYAEDVHSRDRPGLYATAQSLPVVGLQHETKSKIAVFDYVDRNGALEEQTEAREVLYPQIGSEIGGQAGLFFPQVMIVPKIAGAAMGHLMGIDASGKLKAKHEKAEK